MTHIECISAAAGSRSIFPIHFSHMDLIKFYVKALLTTNQTNQLRGESQHHKQIWSRKIYLKNQTKRQIYKTVYLTVLMMERTAITLNDNQIKNS